MNKGDVTFTKSVTHRSARLTCRRAETLSCGWPLL